MAEHDAVRKPWFTHEQQIEHLKMRGVKFELISEDDAKSYLDHNNNYFRLKSYRKGFPLVEEGQRKGEYANLDFKMLVDLSIIDMLLRNEMLLITLNVEHFAKVSLLSKIEERHKLGIEDGYSIVAEFLAAHDKPQQDGTISNSIKNEISRIESSAYASGILKSYPNYDFPVWAFMEVISFGTFTAFYRFAANRFADKTMLDRFYMLQAVKSLRNACAHNNCIINDLKPGTARYKVNYLVARELSSVSGLGPDQRRKKVSNERICQIVTTLYLHKELASPGVLKHTSKRLHRLVERMNKHKVYYIGTESIRSIISFFTQIMESWYPVESTDEKTVELCEQNR